jgi:CheY-like chemotaxis protein
MSPKKKLFAALLFATATGSMIPAYAEDDAFQADKNFSANDQARDLLAEGVREYRAGRYKASSAAFRAALNLNPDNQLLFQFYQSAGDGLLVQMEQYAELEDVLKDVLRKARIFQTDMRHDAAYIELLISKLDKSEEERVVATLELIAVGPVAVPHLVARLADNRQDEMRTHVRITLTRMGYRAVLPLNEVLKSSSERQAISAATILADIGDQRSLPALKRVAEAKESSDVLKQVATNAIGGIVKTSGLTAVPATADLYFAEAQRYFRDGDLVRDELVANEALLWRWDDKAAEAAKLSYVKAPAYAWNELVAEQLIFDGLAVAPSFSPLFPLLAATYAAEVVEVDSRQRLAKERTTPVQRPEEAVAALAERAKAMQEQILRVRLFGAEALFRALQEAIAADRGDVAAFLMRQMQDRLLVRADDYLPKGSLLPEKAGTILAAALDLPNKLVRYEAAITLAHLDPTMVFANSDKVTKVLGDALGEWGTRVILVVDQDFRSRNSARRELQSKGFVVYAAADGFEAMQRLEETPIKDALVIAGDLLPTLKDAHGALIDVPEQQAVSLVQQLAKDWRAEKTPIFISLPENPNLANKIQKAFEGSATVKGFIKKPFQGEDLKAQIEASLATAEVPNANREAAEDIALRAAIALQRPDALRTQFDLNVSVAALVKTLENRADGLRIEALKALANAVQSKNGEAVRTHINTLTDIYVSQDGAMTPALRAAFLLGIGALNPTTDAAVAIIEKALVHEDEDVRSAAHAAVGHALAMKPELQTRFVLQQRLDVRAAGNGLGAAAPAADAKP